MNKAYLNVALTNQENIVLLNSFSEKNNYFDETNIDNRFDLENELIWEVPVPNTTGLYQLTISFELSASEPLPIYVINCKLIKEAKCCLVS